MRLGAEVRARIPGIASGISRRKPASAADGFGTGTPWTTSYQDQMTSPRVQLAAAAAISAQAARRRPDDWRAEIGRAACRERVEISVVAVSLEKKYRDRWSESHEIHIVHLICRVHLY